MTPNSLLKISGANHLKEGQSLKYEIKRKQGHTEAFVIKKNGQFYSYLNLCRHWTVGLDFEDNDFFSEDREWIVCKNHGAIYQPTTGICQSGPCGGAALYRVPLVGKNGMLYADLSKIDED